MVPIGGLVGGLIGPPLGLLFRRCALDLMISRSHHLARSQGVPKEVPRGVKGGPRGVPRGAKGGPTGCQRRSDAPNFEI